VLLAWKDSLQIGKIFLEIAVSLRFSLLSTGLEQLVMNVLQFFVDLPLKFPKRG